MKTYIRTILRGVGQVMLQNNAWTGLLFMVGICYHSWLLGLGAILGNISSTLSAKLFKYEKEDIENGIYGFNGTLVGIAVWVFFGISPISVLFVILGSALSSFIVYKMKKWLPVFTAPFIISTWVVILCYKSLGIVPFISSTISANSFNVVGSISMGLGQVMLQNSIVTGIIFFIAILINSRKSAMYAFYGSLLGALIAIFLSLPLSMINIGLFGFNGVLCAIALGGSKKISFLFATLSVILSVLITLAMNKLGIIFLTAPFVLATWIILFMKNKIKKPFHE